MELSFGSQRCCRLSRRIDSRACIWGSCRCNVFCKGTGQWTRFPLKGGPKVKEVLAKNVPYAREAPKINFDRVFHTKAKTRSKLILEASRPGPLSPWGPLSKESLLVVDWGELINQWLEQIWWVHLPHMLVAKSFPNPLIDWCWCGSHVVPRSQMIGTPQGLSKSCLSTGCTWHSTCHSAQVFQDRPCHEHTGSWTNHQVLRHVGWLLQGESFELIKKTNSL